MHMSQRNTDENRGLRRQSLLIAILCVAADSVLFLLTLTNLEGEAPSLSPLLWTAGVLIVLSDLTLALPARTAGSVAVLQGLVRLLSTALIWQATGIQDLAVGNAAGLAVAGYRAGAWTRGRWSWAALGVLAAGLFVALLLQAPGFGLVEGALLAAAVVTVTNTLLPWLVGRYTAGRAGHIEQIERSAENDRRQAREEVVQAMANERAAIARDLHDTISHHVSAIGIHAAAGRLALGQPDTDGQSRGREAASHALNQVETSSTAAMTDLRRMLDLLAAENVDTVRQPGLADLPTLIDGSRSAGLAVNVTTPGLTLATVPQSLQLTAYRIIQELLTNALRHGDGKLNLVLLQQSSTLTITAHNGLGPRQHPGTGLGIQGMTHRARIFGGDVHAGFSADSDTWRTRVILPLAAS
jgi:signal transduction histidine kinase